MPFNLNVSNNNNLAGGIVSVKLREKSPCEPKVVVVAKNLNSPKKIPTIIGKRFPRFGRNKNKMKSHNVKIINRNLKFSHSSNEPRSHSVERGIHHPDIKRGRSTQSLFFNGKVSNIDKCECENNKESKFIKGLKAIGFANKNKLFKKIPTFKNKFNSDSSAVEGSESEMESVSDMSQKDVSHQGKYEYGKPREAYHRTYSDSSYYGLDRVLEVKESTISPPGTPNSNCSKMKISNKVFANDYDQRQSDSSSENSSSSESSSDDDSSSVTSIKRKSPIVFSSVRRLSSKRGNRGKFKNRSPDIRIMKNGKFYKNDEKLKCSQIVLEHKTSSNTFLLDATNTTTTTTTTSTSTITNTLDPYKFDLITNLDLACPKISIVSYDQEVSACSLTPYHKSNIVKPPLFKSKSATALYCYPSHEYESTLSSVLIAPDYKEHGPCLIPSSRNDSDAAANRIPGSGTPNASTQVNSQHPPVGAKSSHSPAKVNSVPCIHRRSSDSDLSITPKGKFFFFSERERKIGKFKTFFFFL